MTSEHGSLFRCLRWIGLGLVALVVLAAFGFGFHKMNEADAKDARDQKAAIQRANVVCGRAPARIKMHGPSWSWGPWIEVICRDGSTRAVKL